MIEIHRGTQIVYFMKALVNWLNTSPVQHDLMSSKIKYYFEQEIGWILVNLAHGSNEVVHSLLYDRYDPQGESNVPSEVIVQFLRKSISSEVPARSVIGLWFTANACAESRDAAILMAGDLTNFNIFEQFYDIMTKPSIKMKQLEQVMWNIQNYARL